MPPQEPPVDPTASSVLMRAAEAQRQAEAMQRDPELAVARYVDALPGLLDRERAFLKKYPMLLAPENSRLLQSEFNAALGEGLARDSDAFENRVLSGIVRRLEGRQPAENGGAAAIMHPPPSLEPSIERAAERLDHQAHAIHRTMQVADATPLAVSVGLPTAGPAAPARRSLPVSAPVSRDVPTVSGERVQDARSITLSAEERAIARNSFGPIRDASGNLRDLTNEEKERLFASNKAKMLRMKADGSYSG
jgi:hypothetical protein